MRQIECGSAHEERVFFEKIVEEFEDHERGELIGLSSLLSRAADKYPLNIALIELDRSITYKDLYLQAGRVSRYIREMGIVQGDRVFLLYENSIEFYVAYCAIVQLGAVVVPLNVFLHYQELAYILSDARPKAIFVSDGLRDLVQQALAQSTHCQHMHVIGSEALEPLLQNCALQSDGPFQPVDRDVNELAVLLYTSGTTGRPKGVMLSSKNAVTNALQALVRFRKAGLDEHERFFCILPLFHVFAQNTCIWLPFLTGSSVIVVRKIDRKLLRDGLRFQPTLFFGFPALYGLLCLMKDAPLSSVKMFVSGADMLPDKIRGAFAMIYRRKICSGYGLTEASPVIAVHYGESDELAQVVGTVVPGVDIKILGELGELVVPGEIGTLWVRGDNIMMGYYESPEQTAQVLVDGWLNTGDLARVDGRGNLAICGRSKDLIIHKGFNIYPAEIENVLLQHPDVFKAAVVGLHDDQTGQVAIAYVAAKKDPELVKQHLQALCAQNLAAYKIPRKIVCLDDLPMTPTGKIDKKRLNLNG